MEKYRFLGVEIDHCGGCSGVWLDDREWVSLTRGRGKDAVKIALVGLKDSGLICPRCQADLETGFKVGREDFEIDRCPNCHGCFLDSGELSRLLEL